jgi:hypothetical protein
MLVYQRVSFSAKIFVKKFWSCWKHVTMSLTMALSENGLSKNRRWLFVMLCHYVHQIFGGDHGHFWTIRLAVESHEHPMKITMKSHENPMKPPLNHHEI